MNDVVPYFPSKSELCRNSQAAPHACLPGNNRQFEVPYLNTTGDVVYTQTAHSTADVNFSRVLVLYISLLIEPGLENLVLFAHVAAHPGGGGGGAGGGTLVFSCIRRLGHFFFFFFFWGGGGGYKL